jgi:predicted nucleic acid-binding protein
VGAGLVILLDTNYLIRLLVRGSREAALVMAWYPRDELCTSAINWYEFASGPVDEEGEAIVRSLLSDRVLPFTAAQAQEAARLWNATGRLRRLRSGAMIAAAAIVANAELATENLEDFRAFEGEGLRLNRDSAEGILSRNID